MSLLFLGLLLQVTHVAEVDLEILEQASLFLMYNRKTFLSLYINL